MREQPGREVVSRPAALAGDELAQRRHRQPVSPRSIDRGIEHHRDPGGGSRADIGIAPDQLTDYLEDQRARVVAEQIGPTRAAEPVDQPQGAALDPGAQRGRVHAAQSVHTGRAIPSVPTTAAALGIRTLPHHRQDRAVRRDAALPGAGIGREMLWVVEDLQCGPVADHQGRGNARCQPDRHQRSEVCSHSGVGGVRVGCELRGVERNTGSVVGVGWRAASDGAFAGGNAVVRADRRGGRRRFHAVSDAGAVEVAGTHSAVVPNRRTDHISPSPTELVGLQWKQSRRLS
ncbi:Uncharacterised protein [Mycobacteroides abscessus subsp. abscessus]|nr:Uncharacterised protein [Mycobacteroides abscessus subsp. abscessus]